MCSTRNRVFLESRSRLAARAISRNLVHSLKAKSVHIQIILCIRTQKGTRLWDRKITEIRGGPKRGGNLARNSSGRRAGDRGSRRWSSCHSPSRASRQNNNLVLFLRRRARQAAFKRHIRVGIKVNVMLLPGSNKKKKHIRHDYTCKTNGRCHFKTYNT